MEKTFEGLATFLDNMNVTMMEDETHVILRHFHGSIRRLDTLFLSVSTWQPFRAAVGLSR